MNLVVGRITTHPRGFGFVVPDRPLEDVKGDIYIAGSNLNQAMHGDRVVARDRARHRRRRRRAASSASSSAARRRSSAASTSTASGIGFVVPFDRRLIMDVQIPAGRARQDAKPGDMVVGRDHALADAPRAAPLGRVIEVLGDIDEPGVDTEIIIRKYGIPDAHSEEAVEEARRLGGAVSETDLAGPHRLPAAA